jgi:hypothetical protein
MESRRLLLTELSLDAADDMVEAISPFQLPSIPSVARGVRPSEMGAFCALYLTVGCVLVAAVIG